MKEISEIAKEIGILNDELEFYGRYMAKVNPKILERLKDRKNGKLILVTAMNPTSAGEGKTTTTIALSQGLKYLGKR
jgi:Formyltetrahydrofolate synthetase